MTNNTNYLTYVSFNKSKHKRKDILDTRSLLNTFSSSLFDTTKTKVNSKLNNNTFISSFSKDKTSNFNFGNGFTKNNNFHIENSDDKWKINSNTKKQEHKYEFLVLSQKSIEEFIEKSHENQQKRINLLIQKFEEKKQKEQRESELKMSIWKKEIDSNSVDDNNKKKDDEYLELRKSIKNLSLNRTYTQKPILKNIYNDSSFNVKDEGIENSLNNDISVIPLINHKDSDLGIIKNSNIINIKSKSSKYYKEMILKLKQSRKKVYSHGDKQINSEASKFNSNIDIHKDISIFNIQMSKLHINPEPESQGNSKPITNNLNNKSSQVGKRISFNLNKLISIKEDTKIESETNNKSDYYINFERYVNKKVEKLMNKEEKEKPINSTNTLLSENYTQETRMTLFYIIQNGLVITNQTYYDIGKVFKYHKDNCNKNKVSIFLNDIKLRFKKKSMPIFFYDLYGNVINILSLINQNKLTLYKSSTKSIILFVSFSYENYKGVIFKNENIFGRIPNSPLARNDGLDNEIYKIEKNRKVSEEKMHNIIKGLFKKKDKKKEDFYKTNESRYIKEYKEETYDDYLNRKIEEIQKRTEKDTFSDSELIQNSNLNIKLKKSKSIKNKLKVNWLSNVFNKKEDAYFDKTFILNAIKNIEYYYKIKINNINKRTIKASRNSKLILDPIYKFTPFEKFKNFPNVNDTFNLTINNQLDINKKELDNNQSENNNHNNENIVSIIDKHFSEQFNKKDKSFKLNLTKEENFKRRFSLSSFTLQAWLKKYEKKEKDLKIRIDEEALGNQPKSNFIQKNKLSMINIHFNSNYLVDKNLTDIISMNIPKISITYPHLSVNELYDIFSSYKSLLKLCISINKDLNVLYKGLDYITFKHGVNEMKYESKDLSMSIFGIINQSRSGFISFNEYLKGMIILKSKYIEDKVNLFFQIIDSDGNGMLSFQEVKNICIKSLQRSVCDIQTDSQDEVIVSLGEYFALYIFEILNTKLNEEISLMRIKEIIMKRGSEAEYLEMFCCSNRIN